MRSEINKILKQIKEEAFVEEYNATDEECMGILIARYFEWDGLRILEACYYALEDSNFHTENEVIASLIEQLKGKK